MFDVIVIGGSYAGISAALHVARGRRRVLVVDSGKRRNRFATHAHSFLGQDGRAPEEIAAIGRAEVLAYATATWLENTVTDAHAIENGFAVTLASGEKYETKRLVLAMGVNDEMPQIPGASENWGTHIFHCPYCHGYELGEEPIASIATHPMSSHHAALISDWGPTTYFTRGQFEPDAEGLALLDRRKIKIERAPIAEILSRDPGSVSVRLEDDRTLTFAGLFLMSNTSASSPLAAQLGCAFEAGPVGTYVQTDMTKETTVRGVFACGDIALPFGAIAFAVADGARAGAAAHQSLIFR